MHNLNTILYSPSDSLVIDTDILSILTERATVPATKPAINIKYNPVAMFWLYKMMLQNRRQDCVRAFKTSMWNKEIITSEINVYCSLENYIKGLNVLRVVLWRVEILRWFEYYWTPGTNLLLTDVVGKRHIKEYFTCHLIYPTITVSYNLPYSNCVI